MNRTRLAVWQRHGDSILKEQLDPMGSMQQMLQSVGGLKNDRGSSEIDIQPMPLMNSFGGPIITSAKEESVPDEMVSLFLS